MANKTSSVQAFRKFSDAEHHVWSRLYQNQIPKRREQIVDAFSNGLELLGIGPERIPDLDEVNRKLKARTGFEGAPVEGLETAAPFFKLLEDRKFPVGNFIRDSKDLGYTPAPDVFHDLYGHLPFFADAKYADFCQRFGAKASRYAPDSAEMLKYQRLFWFTIEFALVKTPRGKRIFGAGIASSFTECAYALSDEPEVLPFEKERIMEQDFRIDILQKRLFLLENAEQLYTCL